MAYNSLFTELFRDYREQRISLSQLAESLERLRRGGFRLYVRGVNLSQLDLRKCNLSGGIFRDCDFSYTDLRGCNLCRSIFRNCELTGANLQDCVFNNTQLYGCILTGSNLRGCDLTGLHLSYGELSGVILSGACLAYAKLDHVNLSRAYLVGARLHHADLTGADFSYVKGWGADFTHALLAGVNFKAADLGKHTCIYNLESGYYEDYYADPKGIRYAYPGANFRYANFTGANFHSTRLVDCIFEHANLRNTFLFNSDLSGSDLSWTIWENAVLKNVTFKCANLRGANFIGASLAKINWRDSLLTYIRFCGDISGLEDPGDSICNSLDILFQNLASSKFILETDQIHNLPNLILDQVRFMFTSGWVDKIEVEYGTQTTAALILMYMQKDSEIGIIPDWSTLVRGISEFSSCAGRDSNEIIFKLYRELCLGFSNITPLEKRVLMKVLSS